MKCKVTSQFLRDSERQIALFDKVEDAKIFVSAKIVKDASLKLKVIYRIYQDFDTLIEEHDSEKEMNTGSTQSAQGQTSSATFRPTPFDTTPRPPGTPKKWIIDPDDEKKKS